MKAKNEKKASPAATVVSTTVMFKTGKLVEFPKNPNASTQETYSWPCGCLGTRRMANHSVKADFKHCRTHSGQPHGEPSVTYTPTVSIEVMFRRGHLVHFPKNPIAGNSEDYSWPCGCKGTRQFSDDTNPAQCTFTHCETHEGMPEGVPTATFTEPAQIRKVRNPEILFKKGGLAHFGKSRLIPETIAAEVIEEFTWPCGCKGGREFTKLAERVHKHDGIVFFDSCGTHEGAPKGHMVLNTIEIQ
jgi:hypothetical protein